MAAAHEAEGREQINREQRKIVEDTERAGGTIHEFNPDATPQQKAAALRKVNGTLISHLFIQIASELMSVGHASRVGFEECRSRNCLGHRHGKHHRLSPPDHVLTFALV